MAGMYKNDRRGYACVALNTRNDDRAMRASPVKSSWIAVMLVCVAIVAFACPKPCVADEKAVAKATFARAIGLFAKEDYRGALVAFEDSYRIYPRVSTLFNIGMCQKELLLYRDAILSFERFMAKSSDSEHPQRRREAKAALKELEPFVSKLVLTGVPDGSTLNIDERPVGETPLGSTIWLESGRHSVVVKCEGFEEYRKNVKSSAGVPTTLAVVLKPMENVEQGSGLETGSSTASEPQYSGDGVDGTDDDSGWSGLRVTGFIGSVVGVGFVGFGIIQGVKHDQYYEQGLAIDTDTGQDALDEYNDLRNDKQPTALRRSIIGYSVGGALIVTGVTMIIVDVVREKRVKDNNVSIAPGGVRITF